MKAKISMASAEKRLGIIWFCFGGFLFMLMFLQTIIDKDYYGDKVNEAWSWFLPTIFPILSLITIVFVNSLNENKDKYVDKFLYYFTIALSLVYLLCVSLVILLQPLIKANALELMNLSNFGLGPLQGIVIACMGIFFTKK